jgi:iron complex outermembrane receptor protein
MNIKHRRAAGLCVVTFQVFIAAGVEAQGRPPLEQLTVEDLMTVRIQPVFGASERLQPVSEAPANVTIVTAADITRYGYHTLAEILRGVAGFHISDDRNYSYVGIRGVGTSGDYNSRVLLLVNGHKLNDNVYEQAYIGAELALDLSTFERVEIIRGPASSLYGTSAFFAVINIVTKSGASLNGAALEGSAGSLGERSGRAVFGRHFENGVDLALAGRLERSEGDDRLYFPAFDGGSPTSGVAEQLDGQEVGSLYGRAALRNFTVTGLLRRRLKYIPTASFFTVFNHQSPREQTVDGHAMVDAQYDRAVGRTRLTADLSFDRWHYEGIYPFAAVTPGDPTVVNDDGFVGVRWSGGVRMTRPLPGQQTLTAGTDVLANVTQRQFSVFSDTSVEGFDINKPSNQTAFYVQDEIRVRPWLLLNGGVRHDRHEQFAKTSPRGAVIVLPSPDQSFKYLYGRAFRAPNAYELYYYDRTVIDSLRPESVSTHELAWERYAGEWLRTSVSAYHSTATDLLKLALLDPGAGAFDGLAFLNRGLVRSRGLVFEADARTKRGLHAAGHVALQRTRSEMGESLTNAPGTLANVRFSGPGPVWGSLGGFEVQYVASRTTVAGTTVGAVTLAHLTMSTPIGAGLELFGTVRNVFDAAYRDPASEEHAMDAIAQNGRTVRAGIRWRFARANIR